jgi:amino acid adenylation domain-containing protein
MARQSRPARTQGAADQFPRDGRTVSSKPELSDAKRQLLKRLMRGDGRDQAASMALVESRAGDAIVPLSANQRQIWLHAAMAPDVPLYNESITIHRLGSFDLDAMREAVNEILRRHESWRTGFETVDGELVQVIHPHRRLDIPLSDVSHLPEAERDAAALALGSDDARKVIDLADAPLFRARVVKLAEDNHRLYFTLHHIIFDGVSIYRIIVPELAALYAAFTAGKPSPLAEPVLQYGDYAVWQQGHLASAAIERQLDYWRAALAGAPTRLDLAADKPRPVEPTHAGSMEVFGIPLVLTEALKELSRREGVTLYMVLLAAYKAMLHRYSGAEDIVVGGVTDLRRRPELERLVGYFLNTVPLRSGPRGELSFKDYLGEVRDGVLGALGASEVPFDMVVRALKVRAAPGVHPLFNLLFSIEPPVDPFPEGWDLTQMDVVVGAAKFDLYLELDERPDGMIGRFLYSTELFEPASVQRMIGHWLTILAHVVVDPACRLADLPLLTANERALMLTQWNETARDLPTASLPKMIAAHATTRPDAVALVAGTENWTYAELDRETARIAARLRGAGVRAGSLVGVLMERSPETVAGLLAILRLGAAYLPLDPGFPAARLEHVIEDAAPDALLTQRELASMLPVYGCPVVLAGGEAAVPSLLIAPIDGEDLAYVLYTSGSTGKPKGVEVPHRALINLLAAMREEPGFTADDSLLAVTTLSFDIAALEIFLPLLCGGRLILASREQAMDPDRLATLIASAQPSVMQATPATWRALIEAGWEGDRRLRILCGGEALSRDLADQLLARSRELWNMYGPTETTIWSTTDKVERGAGPVAIGRPIANTSSYVLDASGRPVPIGVIGELHLGGTGVALGYRGRSDLTAQRFGGKPVAPGVRLYRTGDLARYDAEGRLYCLGRTDNDEKVRGFRIAIEEVEGALMAHPAIAAAAARSWPDGAGGRYLAAYLVGQDDVIPSIGTLREHLSRLLPEYMIPSRYVPLAALPMTPNRKVDRRTLPEPDAVALPDFAPPVGEVEGQLAAIWREVLDVKQVGRHDSFFDLGGHSLLVTRLLRRVEAEFGSRLTMASVFRAHRLAAMAREIDHGVQGTSLIPIQPDGSRPPLLWLDGGPAFRALAMELGKDQPFLGVPIDEVLHDIDRQPVSLETCAERVAALVRRLQPRGPYYIGGWCTPGILAYAIAGQLRTAGEAVPLLILAEAENPARSRSLHVRRKKTGYHLRQLTRQSSGNRIRYLNQRIHGLWNSMASRPVFEHHADDPIRMALDLAALYYKPQAYEGDVALFCSLEWVNGRDAIAGWSPLILGRMTTRQFASGHDGLLLPPDVVALAAAMREALQVAHVSSAAQPISGARSTRREATEYRAAYGATVPSGAHLSSPAKEAGARDPSGW